MKRTWVKALLLASLAGLITARSALAYIDPTTGGTLFQLLAVLFASLSAVLFIFSRQVRMLLARLMRAIRNTFDAKGSPRNQGLRGIEPSYHDIPALTIGGEPDDSHTAAPPPAMDQEDQDIVEERLRGLGYL
jgi:hypothetical protein